MRKVTLCFLLFISVLSFASQNQSSLLKYGPVAKNEFLWQIAINVRPSFDVSIQQVMYGIYEKNRDKFLRNNIEVAKPGVYLYIPSYKNIKSINKKKAFKFFSQLNKSKVLAVVKSTNKKSIKLSKAFLLNSIGVYIEKLDNQYQNGFSNISSRVDGVSTAIGNLEKKVNANFKSIQKKTVNRGTLVNKIINFVNSNRIVSIVIMVLLLWSFLLTVIISKISFSVNRNSFNKDKEIDNNQDEKSEYDFMGSKEGIPAQLNLAKAYIDMGNKEGAKEILVKVMKDGNKSQQKEARKILYEL